MVRECWGNLLVFGSGIEVSGDGRGSRVIILNGTPNAATPKRGRIKDPIL